MLPLLAGLLLVDVADALVDLDEFGQELLLVRVVPAEEEELLDLDLSVLGGQQRNGLEGSQQVVLLLLGSVPPETPIVKNIDLFKPQRVYQLLLRKRQHLLHLRRQQRVELIQVRLDVRERYEQLLDGF